MGKNQKVFSIKFSSPVLSTYKFIIRSFEKSFEKLKSFGKRGVGGGFLFEDKKSLIKLIRFEEGCVKF